MKKTLNLDRDIEYDELTYDDIYFMYNMLEDKDFTNFLGDKVGASEMWVHIDEANANNYTQEQFLDRLENYSITLNDEDMRNTAIKLYQRYVS